MSIERLCESVDLIPDPRRQRGHMRHELREIVVIALLTILCDGKTFVDMEEFGKDRQEWLKKFMELPNGVPDSDTF